MKRYSSRWMRLVEKNKVFGNNLHFIRSNIEYIDYKDVTTLSNFINKQGQIVPSIFNKLTLKYQRHVAKAIRRARQMALMPYSIVEQGEWTAYPQTRPSYVQDRITTENQQRTKQEK